MQDTAESIYMTALFGSSATDDAEDSDQNLEENEEIQKT